MVGGPQNDKALELKARSERLYMNYALALAVLLFIGGVALTVLGVGDHLDIVVSKGDTNARFINASPGLAMILVAAVIFVLSKPRRLAVRRTSTSRTVEGSAASAPLDQQTPDPRAVRLVEMVDVISQVIRLQEQGGTFAELSAFLTAHYDRLEQKMGAEGAVRFASQALEDKRRADAGEPPVRSWNSDLYTARPSRHGVSATRSLPEGKRTTETKTTETLLYQKKAAAKPLDLDEMERELQSIRQQLSVPSKFRRPELEAFLRREEAKIQAMIDELRK